MIPEHIRCRACLDPGLAPSELEQPCKNLSIISGVQRCGLPGKAEVHGCNAAPQRHGRSLGLALPPACPALAGQRCV